MEQPKTPTYPQIQASQVIGGADAQQQAYALAQQQYAPQMAAQGQGLADIAQGNQYYSNFGPTSLSQAVGSQYMNNIWPQEQAMIGNQFANSGMQNSPALANTMANAYGTLGTNVGQYEQGISNQNATNNLAQLMSINPNSYTQPIAGSITGQSNEQAGLNQQANMSNAQAQYMNSSAQYQQQLAQNGMLGTIGGTALGAVAGGMVGNPLGGAAIGGSLGGAVMGGGSASSLGNSLMAYNYLGNQPGQGGTNNSGNYTFGNPYGSNYGQATSMSNGSQSAYGGTTSSGAATTGNLSNQLFGSNVLPGY